LDFGPGTTQTQQLQAKELLHSALAYLCDDGYTQLPDVEKTQYATIGEAWKEYESMDTPPTQERIITRRSSRPHKGAGCGEWRSERREMVAGEGTGRAGRPPLIGNTIPLIA
jgi:hypothetical protein